MRLSRKMGLMRSGVRWKKYNCNRIKHTSYYYSKGPFELQWSDVVGPGGGYDGYTTYGFNSNTGQYSNAGTYMILYGGDSGTIYQTGDKTICKKIVMKGTDATHSDISVYYSYVQGPYSRTSYSYSLGSYIGNMYADEGEYPDADKGYTYVTTFNSNSITYTVMRGTDGNYYAYAKA